MTHFQIAELIKKQVIKLGIITEDEGSIKAMYGDYYVYIGYTSLKYSKLKMIIAMMDSSMTIATSSKLQGMYIRISRIS